MAVKLKEHNLLVTTPALLYCSKWRVKGLSMELHTRVSSEGIYRDLAGSTNKVSLATL